MYPPPHHDPLPIQKNEFTVRGNGSEIKLIEEILCNLLTVVDKMNFSHRQNDGLVKAYLKDTEKLLYKLREIIYD